MAQLAICQLRRHWLTDPISESELMETGRLAKQALTLAPNLAEAHAALGLFHDYGFREYEPALTEFQRAVDLQPNNSLGIQFAAFVHRRQGKWDLALDELKKSIELDPRNPYILGGLAETNIFLRRWKEAEEFAQHGLTIDPHESTCMRMLLLSHLNGAGNAPEAMRLLATFPPDDLLLPNTGMFAMVIGTGAKCLSWAGISKRRYIHAKSGPPRRPMNGNGLPPKLGFVSWPAMWPARNLMPRKRASYWRRGSAIIRVHSFAQSIGWAYLALGRKMDAINTVRRAVELIPLEKDAVLGSGNLAALAEMQAQTGAVQKPWKI